MPTVENEITYRDFDYRFLAHPITGKLLIRKNAEAIKFAFKNLILTNLYERPYKSSYGGGVRRILFDNYTELTESHIRYQIETAAKNFEQRIELLDIQFGGNPDQNQLDVSIIFRPINGVDEIELSLSLQRVR